MSAVSLATRINSAAPQCARRTAPASPKMIMSTSQRPKLASRAPAKLRGVAVPACPPEGPVNAALVEAELSENEEMYYDSDFECPQFIPEVPSLMKGRVPCQGEDGHGCYVLYEQEVEEREAINLHRVQAAGGANVFFPHAPSVTYKRC